jgi:ABC-type lipoprotein export system ATPase subunit
VTHNEKYAGYGDRIINLLDGWVVEADELSAGAMAEAEPGGAA